MNEPILILSFLSGSWTRNMFILNVSFHVSYFSFFISHPYVIWITFTWLIVFLVTQLWPTLCGSMGCNPPGSSVQGIFQARIPEQVAISSSRGSSWRRNRITPMSPALAGGSFTISTIWQLGCLLISKRVGFFASYIHSNKALVVSAVSFGVMVPCQIGGDVCYRMKKNII